MDLNMETLCECGLPNVSAITLFEWRHPCLTKTSLIDDILLGRDIPVQLKRL